MTENNKIVTKPLNQMTNDELMDMLANSPNIAIREMIRKHDGDDAADHWYENI